MLGKNEEEIKMKKVSVVMETKYKNLDEALGAQCVFTMREMIEQYRLCSWDEYKTDNGTQKMTEGEIYDDILKHNIEPV